MTAWRRPVRRGFGSRPLGLLTLAVVTGVLSGLGAVGFRELVAGLGVVFTGAPDYATTPNAVHPAFPGLGRWFLLVIPVLTGLLYGLLVARFATETRGGGIPEVMLAVARRGGRIRRRVAPIKALATALCLAGGGSAGREGPIVQIGASLASTLAQVFRLDAERVRLLVACGAAGGIAASFNAPLVGVFFVMELVLRSWVAESLGMVVVAAVTAGVIGRELLGRHPFLVPPPFSVDHLIQYPLFAALGVVAGLGGVFYTKTLSAVHQACDRIWRGPEWLRPAVGGLLIGPMLLVLPELYGVGYPVLGNAIEGRYAIGFLLLLFVGKVFACGVTLGVGGSGGTFGPALFCGATLGAAFGALVAGVDPGGAGSPGAYAVVGMAAVFASAARGPVTAMVIVFDLTGEYSVILPLILAVALATGISRLISTDTMYTGPLRRRGIVLDEPADADFAAGPVSAVAVPTTRPLPSHASIGEAGQALSVAGAPVLAVVDDDGRYVGLVFEHEVLAALAAGQRGPVRPLVVSVQALRAQDRTAEAVRRLKETEAVPVVDAEGRLTGWVTAGSLLAALGRGSSRP